MLECGPGELLLPATLQDAPLFLRPGEGPPVTPSTCVRVQSGEARCKITGRKTQKVNMKYLNFDLGTSLSGVESELRDWGAD